MTGVGCESRVVWPEILLVTHFHPGLTQHSQALGVLQPEGGLQKLERLAGELLIDSLDLRLEAGADKHTVGTSQDPGSEVKPAAPNTQLTCEEYFSVSTFSCGFIQNLYKYLALANKLALNSTKKHLMNAAFFL